jgi:hypothetical protein
MKISGKYARNVSIPEAVNQFSESIFSTKAQKNGTKTFRGKAKMPKRVVLIAVGELPAAGVQRIDTLLSEKMLPIGKRTFPTITIQTPLMAKAIGLAIEKALKQ